jgi:hypothetical protein
LPSEADSDLIPSNYNTANDKRNQLDSKSLKPKIGIEFREANLQFKYQSRKRVEEDADDEPLPEAIEVWFNPRDHMNAR